MKAIIVRALSGGGEEWDPKEIQAESAGEEGLVREKEKELHRLLKKQGVP